MRNLLRFFILLLFPLLLRAQCTGSSPTWTSTPDETSVSTCVMNASAGDTINVTAASGSVTWTSPLSITKAIQIIGPGAANLTILDNAGSSAEMFHWAGTYGTTGCASTTVICFRLSGFTIAPVTGSTALRNPIGLVGRCTSVSCPNVRIDNLSFNTWSTAGNGQLAGWLIVTDNVFGVIDHNIIPPSMGASNSLLANVNNSQWKGTGDNGDNSWAQPDSYGTGAALYFENNTLSKATNDCDQNPSGGSRGGCRLVIRFNTYPGSTSNFDSIAYDHGTESGGRMRGGRQEEVYANSYTCQYSNGCATAAIGFRSGTGLVFGNSFTTQNGAWFNNAVNASAYRSRKAFSTWAACEGESPFDTNDDGTISSAYTISSISSNVITVSGSPGWTANQYAPGGVLYSVYDSTKGQVVEVQSNGSNKLTLYRTPSWSNADTIYITGTTAYYSGVFTAGGTNTGMDTTKSFGNLTPTGAPYSMVDATNGTDSEITSNTATVLNWHDNGGFGSPNAVSAGDTYFIIRATACLDQAGRSGGTYYSGSIPTPIAAASQTIDPIYEWADNLTGAGYNFGVVGSLSGRIIANRDYYNENKNQGAQTSNSYPFTGDPTTGPGTGHGTITNRPATCVQGVAYWAENQGSWNTNNTPIPGTPGYTQGVLYICGASGWPASPSYTPYTYPHPLISGGAGGLKARSN